MTFAAQFLAEPDLFPARHSGEPCGHETLALSFVGGPYRFSGLSGDQHATVLGRYADLVVSEAAAEEDSEEEPASADPGVEIDVFRVSASDFRTFELAGWNHEIDFDQGPAVVRFASLSLLGRLDWRGGRSASRLRGALFTPENEGEALRGAFENFFRVMVAYRILELGGLLLHSSGLVLDDPTGEGAHLFLGRSGAGKTTLSRLALAAGHDVLSDDVNAALPQATPGSQGQTRGWVAERLPFAGELAQEDCSARSVPLRAIHRLEQTDVPRCEPLGDAQALALLSACSPFVNADPYRADALLSTATRLLDSVETWRTGFALDPSVFDTLGAARAAGVEEIAS